MQLRAGIKHLIWLMQLMLLHMLYTVSCDNSLIQKLVVKRCHCMSSRLPKMNSMALYRAQKSLCIS